MTLLTWVHPLHGYVIFYPTRWPLQIDKLSLNIVLLPLRVFFIELHIIPMHKIAHNYSIVEDLAHAPCAMSALEVLQSYPTQAKSLLTTIGGVDMLESNVITFDLDSRR
jgi:hypothetical protein